MTVAAVMLVKDEADIIEAVVRHLATQVDEVIVADNLSTDGTQALLAELAGELPNVSWQLDREVGYYQSRKTTALALDAYGRGHRWVIPCDADEVWYAPDMRPLREFLGGVAPDIQIVSADLYNHLPSALDDPEILNPVARIGWRQRAHGALPKVACRLRPDLVIHAGNHSASTSGTALAVPGLVIRHFSWRSREQYLHKIRVGEAAYAATDLPENIGAHWRMWQAANDDAILEHFDTWFRSADPHADSTLIYDPAPVSGQLT